MLNPQKEVEEDEPASEEPVSNPTPKKTIKKKNTTDVLLLIIVILLLIAFGIMSYFFIYIPHVDGNLSLSETGNGLGKAIETWLFN